MIRLVSMKWHHLIGFSSALSNMAVVLIIMWFFKVNNGEQGNDVKKTFLYVQSSE
jgi:hypothetical protein